ncbi:MAG: hypothetical protein AAF542_01855 [Pseudomonadota bacterium]
MCRNKHVVVALLVAPMLALIAYFAVDSIVAEKPQKAIAGSSYPLAAKSNCRYASGRCSLVNGDLRVEIHSVDNALLISSSHAAAIVRAALLDAKHDHENHLDLTPIGNDHEWRGELPDTGVLRMQLRIAIVVAGSRYFAEVGLLFAEQNSNATTIEGTL